ncbi:MAG: tRNA-dihydrouridine synthase, partial [Candidatus Hodarchaeales archaeon]
AMRLKTGVDGVMIGRAARNNPLIFSRIEPTKEQRINCWKRFVELCMECEVPFKKTRLFSLYFMRGFPKAATIREKLSKAADYESIDKILDVYSGH